MKNSVLLIIAVIVGIVIVATVVVEEVAIVGISRTTFVCVRPFSGYISGHISVLNYAILLISTRLIFLISTSPLSFSVEMLLNCGGVAAAPRAYCEAFCHGRA